MASDGILGSSGLGSFVLGGDGDSEIVETPIHRLTEIFPEILVHADPAVTYARVTEIFPEVLIRDPLVAAPARLTEEFAEVLVHDPPTVLEDGPRITSQTVEVLYLEPEAAAVFGDCLEFQGVREWDLRVYDDKNPSTGKRKAYGPDGEDVHAILDEVNFEIQEKGGYGGGGFRFLAEWDKVTFAGNERVDVYLWDEPAYRGYLRIAQKDLNSPESSRPQLYGMVAVLDQWQVQEKYAYGCDTDVTAIFRDIAEDYVQIAGRFPSISIESSEAVGFTLKEYDGRGKSVAQCFNELSDLIPGGIIWGHEMDAAEPIPGDVLYIRPKPTTTAYVVPVGDSVQAFTYPVDTHEIVNSLTPLRGGPVAQPNLMPNPSFEEGKPANEDHGNYLLNPSFEDDAGSHPNWTSVGPDPTVKYTGHVTAHGSARTGNQWAELDEAGEGFYQEVQIVPGRRYEASCWARLEDSTVSNSGLLLFEAYTTGGALLASTSIGLSSLTGIYQRFKCDLDLASYPTAAKVRITVTSNGGAANNDGVLVDDCGVYEYCADAQEFWRFKPTGAATVVDVDWGYRSIAARTGKKVVRVKCSGIAVTADRGELYLLPSQSPSVEPNERYTLIVFWHTNGAGTPGANALTIGGVSIDSSNNQGTVWERSTITIPATPPTTWQCAYFDVVTDNTTARFQPFIRVRTNEYMYIDDAMLVQGEVPTEVLSQGGFWTADTYERYIDVEDSALVGSLDADVADSITDYDEHENGSLSNALVTDRATALAYAAGVFNSQALPKIQAQLSIYGARQLIAQAGKVRIVNLPSPPSALWPSRANYTITPDAINCTVELGNLRPDMAGLLQLTAERARS